MGGFVRGKPEHVLISNSPMKKASKKATSVPDFTRRPDRDRRVRQSERIARVLKVLGLIQSRARWNAKTIADELHCSERTVYRDLEVLEFAGVPWYFDENDQAYRIRPEYRFPTLALTDDEVWGQVIATAITQTPGLNISDGAGPATRKISTESSHSVQQLIEDASRLVDVFGLATVDHGRRQEIVRAIQFALLHGKQAVGTYASPYDRRQLRLAVHPYRLCFIKRAWYVVGHTDGETVPKTFRVARFKELRAIDRDAKVPGDFDLRAYFANAWAVYRGDRSYEVELWFTPEAAGIVTETVWHHTQRVRHRTDGVVVVEFTVDGLTEIANWILSWTGRCKIIKPVELRTMIAAILKHGLTLNSGTDAQLSTE